MAARGLVASPIRLLGESICWLQGHATSLSGPARQRRPSEAVLSGRVPTQAALVVKIHANRLGTQSTAPAETWPRVLLETLGCSRKAGTYPSGLATRWNEFMRTHKGPGQRFVRPKAAVTGAWRCMESTSLDREKALRLGTTRSALVDSMASGRPSPVCYTSLMSAASKGLLDCCGFDSERVRRCARMPIPHSHRLSHIGGHKREIERLGVEGLEELYLLHSEVRALNCV